MPLPRNQIREVQQMKTSEFRQFLKRYGRNMEREAYRRGYSEGTKDNLAAEVKITLQTALKEVKGYGPVLHERMTEHIDKLSGGKNGESI